MKLGGELVGSVFLDFKKAFDLLKLHIFNCIAFKIEHKLLRWGY